MAAAWKPVGERGLLEVNGQPMSSVINNDIRNLKNSLDNVYGRLDDYIQGIEIDEKFLM